MARDLSVQVRETIVGTMSADAAVAALAGPRVYGPSAPAEPLWPFVRMDLPLAVPDPDGCTPNASRYSYNVHGFAKGKDERGAGQLADAICHAVDALSADLDVDPEAGITDTVWTSTQIFRDTAEAEGWHAVVSFYSRVSG